MEWPMSISLAPTEKKKLVRRYWALGTFQTSACCFLICLEAPSGWAQPSIPPAAVRSSIWSQMWPIELVLHPVHSTCWDRNVFLVCLFKSKKLSKYTQKSQLNICQHSGINFNKQKYDIGCPKCLMFSVESRFQSINELLSKITKSLVNHFQRCRVVISTVKDKIFPVESNIEQNLTSWDE